ncbi:LysR family transcriptional regulator [Novosphingobium cyanobacteriorum]|uniref:LysR substrate-binding domain-containing protein n=1 Tax=Novosphingobium cyanobacteriorum TaxID=3024215 RepID=A0ABT6CH10_9SPHN|nr:LysR family transcriptional regulator [Novosphingobium cyanobacteriorum]MDF8333102.1 LysR substrate-binding domain-containing protein [Novosphingobium cyanobacteriorum]
MPVQVRHIQYVIAAADQGSFRRAAAALGVQESAISRRIRELEERLGTAFFIRTPNGVTLTNAGKQFVQRGRKALTEIGLARSEAAAIGRGEDGHIRIGIFSSLASGFLSELIDTFGAQHPAVKLTFIDGNPADHIAAIRKHHLDVAFITGCADWPGCEGRQLWTERIFVVLPAGHRLCGDGEVQFEELAGEPFIVSESAPGEEIHDYLVKRLADLGRHPEIHHQAVSRDNLMRLVALRRGLTVTSEATTAAQFPGVVFRPIAGEVLPFCGVWSPNNENPALHRLLDLAKSMADVDLRAVVSDLVPNPSAPFLLSQTPDPSP